MSRHKRVDAIQANCVMTLRHLGASVWDLHEVGKGGPDALVGYMGENVLVEFKEPKEGLRPNQKQWSDLWRGGPVVVIHGQDEALALIQRIGKMMTYIDKALRSYRKEPK